ncbi:MAG: hypothetical protein AAF404_10645, partial [Pseudomonadota bacterium]
MVATTNSQNVNENLNSTDEMTSAEQRRDDMRTIRKVVPYIWPKDAAWVRWRLVIALAMLVLAKVASVITPLFYKAAVDALAPDGDQTT